MSHKYVVVDLETTGNAHYRGDRIIQLSAVTIIDDAIVDQYTTFVDPGVPVPAFIEELTGINDVMLEGAPIFQEVALKLKSILANASFVAHNVSFDLGFLKSEFAAAGVRLEEMKNIDTVELAKVLLPQSSSYKLSDLSEQLQLSHIRPHQADSDALVTAELLLFLIRKGQSLPLVTLERLAHLSSHLKSDIQVVFNRIMASQRRQLEDLSLDLEVYRGIALKKQTPPEKNVFLGKADYPYGNFEKAGLLSSRIPNFEQREGQFEMMDAVFTAFTGQKHAMIEAGTGLGKSLGYLLPAAYFSVLTQHPVVISTYTIQMQEQLINDEVPKISQMVPFPFEAAILKGRSNYLNMLKFEHALKSDDQSYDYILTMMQLLVWLLETDTGDMDEVNFSSGGRLFRERMRHDGTLLPDKNNPWKSRDFHHHARQKAKGAQLIITNHAMLLKDMESDDQLLPDYHYAVIDEGHQFEHAARSSLGHKIEYTHLKYFIGRLGTSENRQLFFRLERIIEARKLLPSQHAFTVENDIFTLEAEIDDLFMMLSKIFTNHVSYKQYQHHKQYIRLSANLCSHPSWRPVFMCAERVWDTHRSIYKALMERIQLLQDHMENMTFTELAFLVELHGYVKDWEELGVKLKRFLITPEENEVVWLEGDTRMLPNSLFIQGHPISSAALLKEHLFANKKSVVVTSATLSVNESFSFMKRELGLVGFPVLEKSIVSPFDYKTMAKLMIPNDLPDIKSSSTEEYIEAISGHIIAIAEATEGRMLILFTSHDMLRKTYNLLKESGAVDDFVLLAQGITAGSRSRLTKSFQQFNKAILFGTSSFWEGINIEGEDLTCLVMVRLPFSPPDEPVSQAKSEQIKAIGKNPFSEHSLPEAVIRFKQGFGRLIRSNQDRGIVVVFDRRIQTASYGKEFLQSLPNLPIEHGPIQKLTKTIEKWL